MARKKKVDDALKEEVLEKLMVLHDLVRENNKENTKDLFPKDSLEVIEAMDRVRIDESFPKAVLRKMNNLFDKHSLIKDALEHKGKSVEMERFIKLGKYKSAIKLYRILNIDSKGELAPLKEALAYVKERMKDKKKPTFTAGQL